MRKKNYYQNYYQNYNQKAIPDYFLMIPFDNEKFIEGYNKFCEDLIKEYPKGFDENLLQKPQKLHITLALFEIGYNTRKLDKIIYILDNLEKDIKKLSEGNITFDFDGFSCFDDIQNTKVIYGKMIEDDSHYRLCKIIDLIIRNLVDNEIIREEHLNQFNVKFEKNVYSITVHLTLMNTKFLPKDYGYRFYSFNSQYVMNCIQKLKLPECELTKFNLCRMAIDQNTGKYEVIKTFSLV